MTDIKSLVLDTSLGFGLTTAGGYLTTYNFLIGAFAATLGFILVGFRLFATYEERKRSLDREQREKEKHELELRELNQRIRQLEKK